MVRIFFDCDIDKRGKECIKRNEHDVSTLQHYIVKLRSGRKVITKLCQSQAIKTDIYGWDVIATYQFPAEGITACRTCGTPCQEGDTLCPNGVCLACCQHECNACSQCHRHVRGEGADVLCTSDRCVTCCLDHCSRCVDCNAHAEDRCETSQRCRTCCQIGCMRCASCLTHNNTRCGHCSLCRSCCGCIICSECARLVTCLTCLHCRHHCDCVARRSMSRMEYGKPWVVNAHETIKVDPIAFGKDPHAASKIKVAAFKDDMAHRKLFDCTRTVGVEWEFNSSVNDSGLNLWREKWKGQLATDGSCGREAVTPPLAGDHIINCLTDLGKAFETGKAEIDDRCGIHVHVDASDLSWRDMFRLLRTYAHVEPLLYLLGGEHRTQNRYCIPCGQTYMDAMNKPLPSLDIAENKIKILSTNVETWLKDIAVLEEKRSLAQTNEDWVQYKELGIRKSQLHAAVVRNQSSIIDLQAGLALDPDKLKLDIMKEGILEVAFNRRGADARKHQQAGPGKKDGARYKGLNLCPWLAGRKIKAKDTTLEFRLHRNVKGDDAERVINWTKICARLVDWSVKASDNDVKQLPKSALRSLVEVIAPECDKSILDRFKMWRHGTSFKEGTKRRITLRDGKYSFRVKSTATASF